MASESEIERIFHAIAERPQDERGAFLEQACAGDADLRTAVEALLAADDAAETFMESPAFDGLATAPLRPAAAADTPLIGKRIGSYELVRVIASGGMGTVYEAVQAQPRRTVALKVMRADLDSPAALRRFQYESEVLGRLLHPAIAQIYEAGTHEERDGLAGIQHRIPYFAMEYIAGALPIRGYANEKALDLPARIRLFTDVCDAVHHGHQKGVIHRDLKPSNILVDAAGRPKVIDFGVARAIDAEALASTAAQTETRQIVGTLQYMSPEQCDFDPQALDTRSDIYSLGVLLYELLCGQLPYEVTRTSLTLAARTIRETAPRRPSTLNRALRGDLETILTKALEKDRERRYTSAADLAQDLRRYLDRQPIEARPPSAIYQFRKLVARHKPLFASLTLLVVALTAFGISMTVLYGRAERERRRAELAEQKARIEANTASQVSNYLINLFRSLDPLAVGDIPEGGASFSVRDLLDREARTIPATLKDQPLTQATLLTTLAEVYTRLELNGRAAAMLQAALELRQKAAGDDTRTIAWLLVALGGALQRKGEFAAAEPPLRQALELYRKSATRSAPLIDEIAYATGTLATLLRVRGDGHAAVELQQQVLEQQRQHFGADDVRVANSLTGLANMLYVVGDFSGAEAAYCEALDIHQRRSGGRDLNVAHLQRARMRLRLVEGDLEGAEALVRGALELLTELRGTDQSETRSIKVALAGVLKACGQYAEAETLYRETLAFARRRLGDDHTGVGAVLQNLAELMLATHDAAAIEALYEDAREIARVVEPLPADYLQHSGALLLLGTLELARDRPEAAEPFLRECAEQRRHVLSPEHWLTAYAESMLGACLVALQRCDEAQPLLDRAYPMIDANLGRADDRTIRTLLALIDAYECTGRTAEAEAFRRLLPPFALNPETIAPER